MQVMHIMHKMHKMHRFIYHWRRHNTGSQACISIWLGNKYWWWFPSCKPFKRWRILYLCWYHFGINILIHQSANFKSNDCWFRCSSGYFIYTLIASLCLVITFLKMFLSLYTVPTYCIFNLHWISVLF